MTFFKESFRLAKWMLHITVIFGRIRPITTLLVVLLSIVVRVTSVLTFFLPLKVILLAGSDGVPRYFEWLVSGGDKDDWLVWLSIAAVVSFVITHLFEWIAAKLTESSAMDVLQGANEMAMAGRERKDAHTYYSRFSNAVSDGVFSLGGFVLLGLVNPLLVVTLAGLMLLEWIFCGIVLSLMDPVHPGRLARLVRDGRGELLKTFSALNFLGAFFVILAPFLLGSGGNILVAILSVFLLRQMLGAMISAVRTAIDLYMDRYRIDPLVFRSRRMEDKEAHSSRHMRLVFDEARRQQIAEEKLKEALPEASDVKVKWLDSRIRGAFTFHVSCAADGGARHFQQQVFPPGAEHLLGQEEFLFSKVSRAGLHAPEVLSRFRVGEFECQLVEFGRGYTQTPTGWRTLLPRLLPDMWSVQPPRDLVRAFDAAKPSIRFRLNTEFMERLSVSVGSAAEEKTFISLMKSLPAIHARLAALPQHVFNPDLGPGICVEDDEGGYRVLSWVRWAIEPVGFGAYYRPQEDYLEEVIAEVNRRRRDLKTPLVMEDILFARACHDLERDMLRGEYKGALKIAAERLRVNDRALWA